MLEDFFFVFNLSNCLKIEKNRLIEKKNIEVTKKSFYAILIKYIKSITLG